MTMPPRRSRRIAHLLIAGHGRWLVIALLALACVSLVAQDFTFPHNVYPPQDEQIPGPPNPAGAVELCCAMQAQRPPSEASSRAWLAYVQSWRREHLVRMGYDDSQYLRPELKWTQSSFIQPLMMAQERYFYDPQRGAYTVQR
ncbi:MAG: hypothetical protein ACRD4K_15515, partial [Candidatus Acidiferrales bacterium]